MFLQVILLSFVLILSVVAFNPEAIDTTVLRENILVELNPSGEENKYLGAGYNVIRLRQTPQSAVNFHEGQNVHYVSSSGFIDLVYKVRLCKTQNDYKETLQAGLSLSGKFMGLEASSSVNILTETKFTSLESLLVVSVEAKTNETYASDVTIKHNVDIFNMDEKPWKHKLQEFLRLYGTHYLHKIVYGGKSWTILKYSSGTKEDKHNLDAALGLASGVFQGEAELKKAIERVQSQTSVNMGTYNIGGSPSVRLPDNNMEDVVRYAKDFADSLPGNSGIVELHYAKLTGVRDFPYAQIFSKYTKKRQDIAENIMFISKELLEVHHRCRNMKDLKATDFSYFTDTAWEDVDTLNDNATHERQSLLKGFNREGDIIHFTIKTYKNMPNRLNKDIDDIIQKQVSYDRTKYLYLKDNHTRKYIIDEIDNYVLLGKKSPRGIRLEDIQYENLYEFLHSHQCETSYEFKDVVTGDNQYSYIYYDDEKVLCMGHRYYPYLISYSELGSDKSYCQWKITKLSGTSKLNLEYGDRIKIENKYYNGYGTDQMGVYGDDKYVRSVSEDGTDDHWEWIVEKAPGTYTR